MTRFPSDRFDAPPARLTKVGAHRAPTGAARGWVRFAWAALASGVLVVAGLFALDRLDADVPLADGAGWSSSQADPPEDIPLDEPEEQIPDEPEEVRPLDPSALDPELELTLSVLNGTEVAGLAGRAADALADVGWPDASRANADESGVEQTVVYYSDPELEAVALGLAQELGVGELAVSDVYPGVSVTIVIGSDYVAPIV